MMDVSKVDYLLLLYYAVGVLSGGVILYFLPKNEGELERLKSSKSAQQVRADRDTVEKAKTELKKETPSWDGDDIPEEELERIRKRFRLTHEQMARVMKLSKEEATMDQKSYLTPHQRMNRMVYTIMILVLIYILNRDYGNIVLVWLLQMFPTEAKVLGLMN